VAHFAGLFVLALLLAPESCEPTKQERVQLDLARFEDAIQRYERKTGHPPSIENGLGMLVEAQELEAVPLDPWGHDYLLRDAHPGVDVASLGRDGMTGGEGYDADIVLTVPPAWPGPTVGPRHSDSLQ
jgi:general secretion pathway protein G